MDSSFTVRPRDNIARTPVGRSNIVRTDLSPSQSVNAAAQASAMHGSVMHHAPSDAMTREPAIDPQCRSVLDREREEREERERRRARKDEALLRQKAYGRSTAEPPSGPHDESAHADFQV